MFSALHKYFCLDNLFLIYNLILKNLKVRYRGSLLGLFWTVLIPAFTSLIYFVIFKFILKVQVPNYLVFIMSGLIPWTFFSQTLAAGLESLVSNHTLLNKVPLPPQSLVLAESYTYLINLIFSLPVLLIVILFEGVELSFYSLQYFYFLFLLLILANSISIILSFLYVYFRDLKFLVSIVIQFWFYLTPIMYGKTMIPSNYLHLFYYNPIGIMFIALHESILEQKMVSLEYYLTATAWAVALLLISIFTLFKFESDVVESL
jgi:lipopolysaccharide transport system permease protein